MSVYQRFNHASIGATFAAAVPATSAVASAAWSARKRCASAAYSARTPRGTPASGKPSGVLAVQLRHRASWDAEGEKLAMFVVVFEGQQKWVWGGFFGSFVFGS